MTDERYVYYNDIREKKSTATGARHVKRSSRSKKCSLPSDNLSRKEIAAMNGECRTLKFNNIIPWHTFKFMEPCAQKDYLTYMILEGAGIKDIAVDIFDIPVGTLRSYLAAHKLDLIVRHGPNTAEEKQRWAKCLSELKAHDGPVYDPTVPTVTNLPIDADLSAIEEPGEYTVDYSANPDGELVEHPKKSDLKNIPSAYPLCFEYTLDGVTDWKSVMDKLNVLGLLLDQGKYPIGSYRVTLRVQRED